MTPSACSAQGSDFGSSSDSGLESSSLSKVLFFSLSKSLNEGIRISSYYSAGIEGQETEEDEEVEE